MKYDSAALDYRWKLMIIGLLEKIKIKIKQQALFTTKTIKKIFKKLEKPNL